MKLCRRHHGLGPSAAKVPAPWRGAALLLLPGLPLLPAAAAAAPMVTIAEARSTVVSNHALLQPAAGLRLEACDRLRTGPRGLLQVEFDDGSAIDLAADGGDLVVGVPPPDGHLPPLQVLLSGWAKLSVPAGGAAGPHRLSTPRFDVLVEHGVAVVHVDDRNDEVFVERGAARVQAAPGDAARDVAVAAGRSLRRSAPAVAFVPQRGAGAAFLAAMPGPFRDTLPARRKVLESRAVERVPMAGAAPPEWPALPALQACQQDSTWRRVQQALLRQGFEFGPVDGLPGPLSQAALRAFQLRRGLLPTGEADLATLQALGLAEQR